MYYTYLITEGSDIGNAVDKLIEEKLDEQREELEAEFAKESDALAFDIVSLEAEVEDLKHEVKELERRLRELEG